MEFDLTDLSVEKIEPPDLPSKAKITSRLVANLAAGAVSSVVVSIIHQNTTTYSKTQTVKLYVGAYVMGAIAADKAADYVEEKLTPTFDMIENWLWIPVEPDLSVPTDLEVLIQAIPKKQ